MNVNDMIENGLKELNPSSRKSTEEDKENLRRLQYHLELNRNFIDQSYINASRGII